MTIKNSNLVSSLIPIAVFCGSVIALSTAFGYTFFVETLGLPELPIRYIHEYSSKTSDLWVGIYHGAMIPASMLKSYFEPTVTLWDANNTGIGYNFGFLIGAGLISNIFGIFKRDEDDEE